MIHIVERSPFLLILVIFVMVARGGFPDAFPAHTESPDAWPPYDAHTWQHHYSHNSFEDPLTNSTAAWKKTELTLADFLIQSVYPFPLVISPIFPLLLVSLARQKNSPDTKKLIKTEYDYIVIGSGAAGSVVASRLSEVECVNVLLLEAGKGAPQVTEIPAVSGALVGGPLDWKIRTVPQKHTAYGINNNEVPMPRGKIIGGSTNINTMLYIRGNRKDYDNWEAEGAIGWGWKDVFPYFLKSENNTDYDIVQNGYHSTRGPMTVGRFPGNSPFKYVPQELAAYYGYPYHDINGPSQIGFADFQGNIRHGQRCSNAKAYLVPAEDRENLDIVTEAFVTKILIAHRKAVGVQFDYKGKRYEIGARREVILSAGTLNSPKLLMLSGIGPRNILERFGIPVIADLPVGKNLHDHPSTVLNFSARKDVPTYMKQGLSLKNQFEYLVQRSGVLADDQGIFSLAFLPYNYTKNPHAVPDLEIYFMEAMPLVALTRFQLSLRTFLKLYTPYMFKPNIWCLAQVLHPRSRGYVSIKSRDPYDPPVVDPNFLADPKDLELLVEAMKKCMRMARSPPMQKFGITPFKTPIPGCEKYFFHESRYLTCYARHFILSLTHDVGTVRMGHPYDPRTVVDPELRVKTIKGLRVVDSSIIPVVPSGNTWNPVVMVGEKASDIIKETIDCYWRKK